MISGKGDWKKVKKEDFKILVAEDDEMVRDVVFKILTDEGYPVILANDGSSAIKLLRLEDIKMVITDLRMPGADGMDVLRNALQINPQIVVVLVTAYGTLDVVLEAMKEGAYDYLVKPFVMAQLLIIVRNAFKLSGLMEENKNLLDQLKETYRSLENVKTLNGGNTEIPDVEDEPSNVKAIHVVDQDEAEALEEVKESVHQSESVKRYSSLVYNLRTEKR